MQYALLVPSPRVSSSISSILLWLGCVSFRFVSSHPGRPHLSDTLLVVLHTSSKIRTKSLLRALALWVPGGTCGASLAHMLGHVLPVLEDCSVLRAHCYCTGTTPCPPPKYHALGILFSDPKCYSTYPVSLVTGRGGSSMAMAGQGLAAWWEERHPWMGHRRATGGPEAGREKKETASPGRVLLCLCHAADHPPASHPPDGTPEGPTLLRRHSLKSSVRIDCQCLISARCDLRPFTAPNPPLKPFGHSFFHTRTRVHACTVVCVWVGVCLQRSQCPAGSRP